MVSILYFTINSEKLFLEEVLSDYFYLPTFFICKSESSDKRFLTLCIDSDDLFYITTEVSRDDLRMMLLGNMPIREIFLKQEFYYLIKTGIDAGHDSVEKRRISDLDKVLLPPENTFYHIPNDEIKNYASTI